MATIYTTLDSANEIKDLFKRFDRDVYPFGVYEAIERYIQEAHGEEDKVELDVIAWCCDISETDINEWNRYHADEAVETVEELSEKLGNLTTVLYVDEDKNVVYHLAY